MPKTARSIASALAASALFGPAALAHHSMERFDATQTITIQGVVTEFEWANPHVYIYLDQVTDDGETVAWQVEGFPPSILRRQGWTRDMLNVGDTLSVTGNPSKIEENATMFLTSMEHAAETYDTMTGIMALTSAGDAEVAAAPARLNGNWTTLLEMSLVAGFGEERLQLTEAGAAAKEAFDETTMHPGLQCIPFPPPLMMFTPDIKQILSNDEIMLIGGEFDGAVRTIHLDQDSHEGAPRSVLGHSIAHWEDDALVIDTANFADNAMGADFGVPTGAQKHLIERLTLNEDGASLTYAFEFTDPEYFTEAVTGEVQWVYTPDETYAPPPCDPENARRFIND
ncbi:MAG: DUF6152 family protein [Maricaulaceae bacterium]|jgi:hypothetical protein